MSMKIYNADEITVVFGPVIISSGFADGTFVEIEQESDDFTDVVGAAGEVTRNKTSDRRATVTLTLMQTADANDALSVINNLDRNTDGAAGVNPLVIRDRNGRALYEAEQAWIQAPPTATFDREATERAWVIRCANLVRFDGGNVGP